MARIFERYSTEKTEEADGRNPKGRKQEATEADKEELVRKALPESIGLVSASLGVYNTLMLSSFMYTRRPSWMPFFVRFLYFTKFGYIGIPKLKKIIHDAQEKNSSHFAGTGSNSIGQYAWSRTWWARA